MLPELDSRDALFLDFDGTLVEIAARPQDVVVAPELVDMLSAMQEKLSGAVAIISGRPIGELDRLLHPAEFAAAGEHGAEIRFRPGEDVVHDALLPSATSQAIQRLAAGLEGTEAEIKRASASLHYRRAPHHQSAVEQAMRTIEEQLDGYALILGKMVVELKPESIDKGLAISDIYSKAPFSGRRPVFVGDDTTDEAGFAAVNDLGGLSIRVGDAKNSHALHHAQSVGEVLQWLESAAAKLE